MSYTNNLDNTLPMLNVNTKLFLTTTGSGIQDWKPCLHQGSILLYDMTFKKLSDKFLGPYEILALPSTHSIILWLLDSLHTVHLVFHISMLEPATLNLIPNCVQPPPLPIIVNDKPEFEISEILDSKIDNQHCACKLLYLVHWTGYGGTDEETSWILASELGHASKLVMEFHSAYPAKSGPFSSL